nr:MAG TPA: dUTPase [Caudoviricetes sp.]
MKVTIQKTLNVPDPVRAHDTDAGLDLHVPEGQGCLVRPGAVYTIDLGCRAAIPDGYYGQLALRSSAGAKGLAIPHGAGIIDSGYRGNLKVLVVTLADPVLVAAGERLCQLIILPLPHVDVEVGVVDDNTDRGTGGFGSTGTSVKAGARHHEHPAKPDSALTARLSDEQGRRRRSRDAAGSRESRSTGMNRKTGRMNDRIDLTVGILMRELQEIAFRYGNDTPVVLPTTADADYEQSTTPIVTHARREPVPDDWDLFHIDPTGEAVAVIS